MGRMKAWQRETWLLLCEVNDIQTARDDLFRRNSRITSKELPRSPLRSEENVARNGGYYRVQRDFMRIIGLSPGM